MINRIHPFSDCLTPGRRAVTGIPAMRLFMRLLWVTVRCGFFTVRAGLTGWLRLDAIVRRSSRQVGLPPSQATCCVAIGNSVSAQISPVSTPLVNRCLEGAVAKVVPVRVRPSAPNSETRLTRGQVGDQSYSSISRLFNARKTYGHWHPCNAPFYEAPVGHDPLWLFHSPRRSDWLAAP